MKKEKIALIVFVGVLLIAIVGAIGVEVSSDKFIVQENGNVGIGTSSPNAAKLTVVGNTNTGDSGILIQQSQTAGTGNPGLLLMTNHFPNSNRYHLMAKSLNQQGGGYVDVFTLNHAGELYAAGNVGIGTSPAAPYKLNVNGPVRISGNTHIIGDASIGGTTTVSAIWSNTVAASGGAHACWSGTTGDRLGYCTSDEGLKTNIKPYDENVLGNVMKLQPKSFNLKSSLNEPNVGFIAQDILPLFPNAVKIGNDGYYAFDNGQLVPYLTKAIQEQQKQIDELERKVEELSRK